MDLSYIEVNVKDLMKLDYFFNKPGFYLPAETTSSFDIMDGMKDRSLYFQIKINSQLSPLELLTEARKLEPFTRKKKYLVTFVIVPLGINRNFEKGVVPPVKFIDDLAYHISSSSKITSSNHPFTHFDVPENMEIIVLLPKGAKQFIGEYCFSFLEKREPNFQDYLNELVHWEAKLNKQQETFSQIKSPNNSTSRKRKEDFHEQNSKKQRVEKTNLCGKMTSRGVPCKLTLPCRYHFDVNGEENGNDNHETNNENKNENESESENDLIPT